MYDTVMTTDTDLCAAAIKRGRVVAFSTETVYGLGADCFNEEAVKAVFDAKGRPADNPLIIHVCSIEQAKTVVKSWTQDMDMLARNFWPGPLSLVAKKADAVPDIVSGGKDTVAVRMPGNFYALDFIKKCGVPIAAPSANTSTRPSPTKAIHVLKDMNGKIPYILGGGDCAKGIESTVYDMESRSVLRPGTVTAEDIERVIGNINRDLDERDAHKSPGTKYPHYSPAYKVVLVEGENIAKKTHELYNSAVQTGLKCVILDIDGQVDVNGDSRLNYNGDVNRFARELYDTLISHEGNTDVMFITGTAKQGVGLAVMNRLEKAAAGNIVIS